MDVFYIQEWKSPFQKVRGERVKELLDRVIMKTRLFKYTEKYTTKKWKFSDKKKRNYFIFLLKT